MNGMAKEKDERGRIKRDLSGETTIFLFTQGFCTGHAGRAGEIVPSMFRATGENT
jgi:hypothetical protein